MKNSNNFGDNLWKARYQAKLSQKMIADKLGTTSRVTISHWETGYCEPSVDDILKLCTILKTTPNKLLGW